ncbi:MAG: OmpA family protein [Planctomycetes bacterium]|nr:OmpA family protein [Planctomycetota bacterium]
MADTNDAPAGVPEWVVTYGDMMSLLLTFFIMLVSLSQMKQDDGKMRAALDAIRQAFGASVGESGSPGRSLQSNSAFDKLNSRGQRSDSAVEQGNLTSAGRGGPDRPARRINHGTVISLGGPVMFEAGRPELSKALRSVLDRLAVRLANRPNRIAVRGHTSPAESFAAGPAGSAPVDALELSFKRARGVADYLASRGIDRSRLELSAAGAAEPRTRPRDLDSQHENRRVDVFILDTYISRPRAADAPP